MKAALSTEGKMMTHSALSSKFGGILSGMSRISLRTVPQLSRRSVSFLSSFAERGRATRAHVIRNEINRLSTNHLVVVSGLNHHRVPAGWVQAWSLSMGMKQGLFSYL